jgi:surfactin synthase thioesterase subunit
MDSVKLFCFPYAGGSAMIYKKWRSLLRAQIEIIPVELAGRGKRIAEPLYPSLGAMVDDVYSIIEKQLHDSPYAIFGHSMGSMIAYQIAQRIRNNDGISSPSHLFFSGRGAPHIIRTDQKKFSKMPMEEFKKELINLGGTVPEFFDYPDLLEILLPMLKNDFFLAETLLCKNGEVYPLPYNITVLAGKEEDLTTEQVEGWRRHTSANCDIHYVDGGHFFINSSTDVVTEIINKTLTSNVLAP